MDGGSGGEMAEGDDEKEAHRVAFMLAGIAAYQRDKARARKARSEPGDGVAADPWKLHGRRARLRGELR
jgi:hypothetical protein